jgi:hypothetical protein
MIALVLQEKKNKKKMQCVLKNNACMSERPFSSKYSIF